MPELPEVETVCRALAKTLDGRHFENIKTFAPALRYPLELEGNQQLLASNICDVRRRGRYIIVELANLSALIIHLGMTGKMRISQPDELRGKHEHVFFYLDNGKVLRYDDTRRFGYIMVVKLAKAGALPDELSHLGPEPLSRQFNGNYLFAQVQRHRCPIKNLIMDNRCVTGVGNIYASEALFLASIHPARPASDLDLEACQLLVRKIKYVLKKSIQSGGTTIIDFKGMDGSEGKFHLHLNVYGKAGQGCGRCKSATIEKVVIGGRSSFFCRFCQPPPDEQRKK